MARKLIFGNDIQFSTSTGIATVKGIFPAEKILVISDVVTNKTLYSFSDPTTTITCSPDYDNKQTTIAISPSTSLPSGISPNLQVYVEKEELEIKPSRTYRDPVSKLRVSEGESIIDTDFEYGLQSTKWETVRLVNNIPTYYSSTFSEEALKVSSVTPSPANNPKLYDLVTVNTKSPHGLVKGSIVEISGLTDIKYEGVFVVKETPTSYTFTYFSTSSTSGTSKGSVSTLYTLIYPGSFYTGSGIEILDVSSLSSPSISTITISTPNIHKLNKKTNLYLKRTRGTSSYEFLSSSDVVGFGTTSQVSIINNVTSSGTGRSEYYANLPIIQDNWIGSYEINFGTSAISNNKITYNCKQQLGPAQNNPLKSGDFITFYTPAGNDLFTVGSMSNGYTGNAPFKCFKVLEATTPTASGITTFSITSDYNGGTVQTITSVGTTTFGNHRAIKGVRVQSIVKNTNDVTITHTPAGIGTANDKICFAANNSSDINWATSSNNRYTNYYTKKLVATGIINSTTLIIGKDDLNLSFLRNTSLNPVGVSSFIIAFKIRTTGFENAIYLPPSSGFSTESFETAQIVVLTGVNTTTNTGASDLGIPYIVGTASTAEKTETPSTRLGQSSTTGITSTYYLKKTTDYPNWYNIYRTGRSTSGIINDTSLQYEYDIVLPTNQAPACFKNIYTFNSTANKKDIHTIKIKNFIVGNNGSFIYSKRSGSTSIGGLVENNSYIVKKPLDSANRSIDSNKFRVTNGITTSSYLNYFAYPASSSATGGSLGNEQYNYALLQLPPTTSASDLGITTGSHLQITNFSADNNPVQNRFINQVFRVHDSSTIPGLSAPNSVGIFTFSTKFTNILLKIDSVGFNTSVNLGVIGGGSVIPPTSSGLLGSKVVGIITFSSIGSGTQVASLEEIGTSDGIYEIETSNDKTFTFEALSEIPIISKGIVINKTTGSGTEKIGTGATPAWIYIPEHNFADGTKLTYTYQGSQPLDYLTNNTDYYCRVLDKNHISLYVNSEDAVDRSNVKFVTFGTNGLTGITTHTFETSSIKAYVSGPGFIGIASGSNIITGLAGTTKFLSEFSNGDLLRLYQLKSTTGPGTYFETKITNVKSDVSIQIEDFIDPSNIGIGATTGIGTANYFIATRLYPIVDSKASHRSFDGGVSMTSGVTPNSQIIRQTRKYFRYQSGKGIQCSMAINFNPTYDIDTISKDGNVVIIKTKSAHNIPRDYSSDVLDPQTQIIKLYSYDSFKKLQDLQEFYIKEVLDGFTIKLQTSDGSDFKDLSSSFYQYNVQNWRDCSLKAGMFDEQNGFFYKYDGSTLYAVRRDSTQQLSGTVTVSRNDYRVVSTVNIDNQLSVSDKVVIRGQTYKVTSIIGKNQFYVQPAYRGQYSNNVVISKVIDTEIPQSNWNIDKCDGTGPSGYNLNVNKIQMIYMDYSWYGAGLIRFGFKNQDGEVIYVHEFVHNNDFTESYFRSGNLPARYEVETFDDPGYGPSLFHWGVSVMMDGRFDDDKAYLFTADSNVLPFTNGGLANSGSGARPQGIWTSGSTVITGISQAEASTIIAGETIAADNGTIPPGTKIASIEVDDTSSTTRSNNDYKLNISNPTTGAAASQNPLSISSGTANQLKSFIPLVSIRLAPSVDNSTTGNLGFRDIINRMQLTLKSAGVLTTHDCEVRLILNPRLSRDNYTSVGSPSLSQIYKHEIGDTFSGGIVIYSFRAQGGGTLNPSNSTGRRALNVTSVSLTELALLGNSVLGGDGIYPDGPDVLTIAVKPVDTSTISGGSPFIISSRISWAEAQA